MAVMHTTLAFVKLKPEKIRPEPMTSAIPTTNWELGTTWVFSGLTIKTTYAVCLTEMTIFLPTKNIWSFIYLLENVVFLGHIVEEHKANLKD